MIIVLHRIEQEKFMSLNRKLWPLSISLNFWVRLILIFVFKTHHAPKEAQCFTSTNKVCRGIEILGSLCGCQ